MGEGRVGSYGVVFAAIQKKTQERRAIKRIDRAAVNAEKEPCLLREINILRELVYYPTIGRTTHTS